MPALGWFILRSKDAGGPGRVFFILLIGAITVGVAAPGKNFPHYYQLFLAPLTILSALFIDKLASRPHRRARTAATAVFIVTAAYLLYFQALFLMMTPEEISMKKYGYSFLNTREIGTYLKTSSRPGDTLFDSGVGIGIYYYSGLWSPTPFIFPASINNDSVEGRKRKSERIIKDLRKDPPTVLIINKQMEGLNFFLNPVLKELLKERYELVKEWELLAIYRREEG